MIHQSINNDDTQEIINDYENTQEQQNIKYDAQGLSEQEIEGLTCLIITADHTWEHQQPGVPSQVCSFPINEDTNRIHTTTLEVGNLLVTIQEKKQ